ncbi:2-hydroxyacid dehydrogenase [Sphaerisporangium aureirubrum]|uniref:2-hydroxyacid dehydrogenase n=1 Tax=Sphaerisporangium aureirubrum TaxID=1544736 RepID=A0ABW1NSX9_9ACTN
MTGTAIDRSLLGPLERRGFDVRVKHPRSEDDLARELRGAVAYLHGGEEKATEKVLRSAGHSLKVIAFLGVGYENFVDVATARALGIVVTHTPGAATDSVAIFTVQQIMNANTRNAAHLGGRHPAWRSAEDLPRELSACEIGIVGLGAIGTRVAELLRAFGIKVSYFSRTRKPEIEAALGISYLSLPELAARSDVLVVMVPESDETKGLIDFGVLGRLRKGAILVNTARPAVVDPHDLHKSMKEAHVGAAVFDGFYDENSEIANILVGDFGDRLLVTGHIASHTREAMGRMVSRAVASIEDVLTGGAIDRSPGIRA